jgi:hypothetical protein
MHHFPVIKFHTQAATDPAVGERAAKVRKDFKFCATNYANYTNYTNGTNREDATSLADLHELNVLFLQKILRNVYQSLSLNRL